MRVLVTGASGFVGPHVVDALNARGADVLAWGLTPRPDCEAVSVDLCDSAAIESQDLGSVEAVIHLAGLAAVGESFHDPARYLATNPGMQANLMESLLARKHLPLPRILVVSTGAVYAETSELLTEMSPLSPASPYAVSKLTQEYLAFYYAKRGFPTIVARPFNHIGPGQAPGYLIADVAKQLVELERRGGGELKVGNLQTSRDYTDVRDVANAYAELISNDTLSSTYNICSGQSHQGNDIVAKMITLINADVRISTSDALQRPTDAAITRASNAKICRETVWRPKIALEDSLRAVIDDWRSRLSA